MNLARLLLGLFGVVVAAVFFLAARGYPDAAAQMPIIYSSAVGALSLAMVGHELLRRRRSAVTSAGEATDTASPPRRWLAVVAVFALAIGYVVLMPVLGYLLASALFMALSLSVLRTVSVRFALTASAVLIAVVCLVFVQFLGLPIPLLPSMG